MRRNTMLSACMLTAFAWTFSGTALAQNLSGPVTRNTYITFSQPVMVPGMTLPAGKYMFTVVGDGRTIVQIYTGDRAKLVHTAMSVRAARSDQPEKPEVRLIESSADTPPAIGTWWYPEMRTGWEFIYPREQAMTLAKSAKQPILTTAENVPADEVSSAKLVRVGPSGDQSAFDDSADPQPAPVVGTAQVGEVAEADANANRVAAAMNQPSGSQGQSAASNAGAAPAAQSAQAQTTRTTLPQTASSTPGIALAGLLALAAALVLRRQRRSAA